MTSSDSPSDSLSITLGHGTPCWVDVPTPDPQVARDFYGGLLGWEFEVDPNPDTGHYTSAISDGEMVAGLYQGPTQEGQPIMWTLYLAIDDVAETAKQIGELGGTVLMGPLEIPGEGHLLIATDPTGGAIGFWQATKHRSFGAGRPNALGWAELNTRDGAKADAFFSRLFGYSQQQIGDGKDFDYTIWSTAEGQVLGRLQMTDKWGDVPPHWMIYFTVDPEVGTDGAAQRVSELGGKVCIPSFDSPYGRIAVVEDPAGATFSLIDVTRTSEPGGAEVDDPNDD